MTQKYPFWKDTYKPADVRRFFGVVFGTLEEVRERLFPGPQEPEVDEDLDDSDGDYHPIAPLDPLDTLYEPEVPWTPTSLYRWAYLSLKYTYPELVDAEQRDEILLRMQRSEYYDAIFFDSDPRPASQPDEEDPSMGFDTTTVSEATERKQPFIYRLAPKLLCDILTRAHDGLLYFPVIVTHVDNRFRALAESFPALWTTIDSNLPVPFIKKYLENSRTSPLTVRMNISHFTRGKQSIEELRAITICSSSTDRESHH
ncbi:hypothetical protein FRB90_011643 [Tulasnella sp. 427]|nr:hypothetical protein FRB90_011643 [Tulasnella sp. 427]